MGGGWGRVGVTALPPTTPHWPAGSLWATGVIQSWGEQLQYGGGGGGGMDIAFNAHPSLVFYSGYFSLRLSLLLSFFNFPVSVRLSPYILSPSLCMYSLFFTYLLKVSFLSLYIFSLSVYLSFSTSGSFKFQPRYEYSWS